jgi:hypothetical protein
MRNPIDIDAAFSRAIIREIGERLRASVGENELPARLIVLLDRLDQLDDHSSPSGVPELESEKFGETTAARRSLVSPVRWTTRWRTRHRRARLRIDRSLRVRLFAPRTAPLPGSKPPQEVDGLGSPSRPSVATNAPAVEIYELPHIGHERLSLLWR